MAKIYCRKIMAGDINPTTGEVWTINDVPARWQTEVQALLDGGQGGFNEP
jgi:hypothetical protein